MIAPLPCCFISAKLEDISMNSNHLTFCNTSIVLLVISCFISVAGFSPKGTGEVKGVCHQQLNPELVKMENTTEKIDLWPYKHTMRKSVSGTHFMVRTNEELINVHLAPTAELSKLISAKENDLITLSLFQTDKLTRSEYIAKEVVANGKSAKLMNDNLRPAWAHRYPAEKWRCENIGTWSFKMLKETIRSEVLLKLISDSA